MSTIANEHIQTDIHFSSRNIELLRSRNQKTFAAVKEFASNGHSVTL